MVRKSRQYKIAYLLDKLSLGEIQSHTHVLRLTKPGRKPKEGPDLRPIVRRVKIVKGTGIPASTLRRIKNLEIKPGKVSAKKLIQFYNRWQYQRLRAAGANYRNARNFKTHIPNKIDQIVKKYGQNARKIQGNYEKTYYHKVKVYKKQERDKLAGKKPPEKIIPPAFPEPPELPEQEEPEISDMEGKPLVSAEIFKPEETYLDIDEDEEEREPEYFEPVELTEPPPDDYPSLDEVLYGMSESDHDYNEWDDIADTSGTEK